MASLCKGKLQENSDNITVLAEDHNYKIKICAYNLHCYFLKICFSYHTETLMRAICRLVNIPRQQLCLIFRSCSRLLITSSIILNCKPSKSNCITRH